MNTPLQQLAEAATSAAFRAVPMSDEQAIAATLRAIDTLRATGHADEADAYEAALPKTPRTVPALPPGSLMDPRAVAKLLAQARRIDPYLQVREGYIGRGMDRPASVAFTSPYCPDGPPGKDLAKLGFASDNMGIEYIYYTHNR